MLIDQLTFEQIGLEAPNDESLDQALKDSNLDAGSSDKFTQKYERLQELLQLLNQKLVDK